MKKVQNLHLFHSVGTVGSAGNVWSAGGPGGSGGVGLAGSTGTAGGAGGETRLDRRIDAGLVEWKNKADRKPLLLYGARQVGKTNALHHFAQTSFQSAVFVDFMRNPAAAQLFQGTLDPRQIVSNLELYSDQTITPDSTLIVLDEIQQCEAALTSLKYFCEEAPQYCVVGAGSLLGVRINRQSSSFPVGKVDMLHLYPLDFEEYLWAWGDRRLADGIREAYEDGAHAFAFHERAMDRVREYCLVGGMPEVVTTFMDQVADQPIAGIDAYTAAYRRQSEIVAAYLADIAKYALPAESSKILAVWQSLPQQLAKENHKFQYKVVQHGGRASQFRDALDWLEAAGMVLRCVHVDPPQAPLETFADHRAFKIYLGDVGLLSCLFHASPLDLKPTAGPEAVFRGGLMENYVLAQLKAADVATYFWGTTSRAEIEFVARHQDGSVVPIEVKSGVRVKFTSLNQYQTDFHPSIAVRISAKNFGVQGNLRTVPLYAARFLANELV